MTARAIAYRLFDRAFPSRPYSRQSGVWDGLERPDIFGECLLPFTEDVDSAALMTPVQVSECVRAVADAFIAARLLPIDLTVSTCDRIAVELDLERVTARLDEVWPGFKRRVILVDAVRRDMTPEIEIPAETDEEAGAA